MDLILDARGALAWSRGPTAAPILSVAATRLTREAPHIHGRSAGDPEGGAGDPPGGGDPTDPLDTPPTSAPAWQADPAVWAAAQFAAARLGHAGRTARLVALA